MRHTQRKEKMYILSANCKPIDVSDVKYQYKDYPFQMIERDSRNRDVRKIEAKCMFDDRYKIASYNTDLTTMDFIFNYAEFTAFVSNHAGLEWIPQHNKLMMKYLDYGYMPVVSLPTFAINSWTSLLLGLLDSLHVPYLRIPAVPVVGTAKLSAYDYVAHRMDISEALTKMSQDYIKSRENFITNNSNDSDSISTAKSQLEKRYKELDGGVYRPENLRLVEVTRRLFQG